MRIDSIVPCRYRDILGWAESPEKPFQIRLKYSEYSMSHYGNGYGNWKRDLNINCVEDPEVFRVLVSGMATILLSVLPHSNDANV